MAEYERASPRDLSYVESAKRLNTHSDAGALIVPQGLETIVPQFPPKTRALFFARAVLLFRPPQNSSRASIRAPPYPMRLVWEMAYM